MKTDTDFWVLIFVILIFLFICIKACSFSRKKIGKIDKMTGEEFEAFLKKYFTSKGYDVSLTKRSGDFGADLVLKKGKSKTVVQAKRYKGKVGLSAVQEAHSAIKFYHARSAMVVTNSYFTGGAKKLAKANNVKLWDRDVLLKKMAKK